MTLHPEIEQGSDQWLALRCGLLTASEMKHIITPTLKVADNDKSSGHLYELVAQRITKYVEPAYVSDDMLRGIGDEVEAKIIYNEKYAPVTDIGFITEDKFGFTIGYSPDGLIGDDGLIECKSRKQKLQVETILTDTVPKEHIIQIQTGLLVSGRKWCDYVSYCGGMPMFVKRVLPDATIQAAILQAATLFEQKAARLIEEYKVRIVGLTPTERKVVSDIII